jgi:hypothetical protein
MAKKPEAAGAMNQHKKMAMGKPIEQKPSIPAMKCGGKVNGMKKGGKCC